MAALTFNKFNSFAEATYEGVHDFSADSIKIMLTNVAPVATNTQKSDLTEIAAGNGYTAGGIALTITSSQTTGTYTAAITGDTVWTASGGNIAQFRYAVAYNDDATNDELVGWWDHGSAVDITAGNTYTLETDGVNLISNS